MNDLQPAMQGAAFSPVGRRVDRPAAQAVQRAAAPARPSGMRIDAVGLSRHYGERTVLAGIDLRIAPGEFVAVVGRSGCGKSTLLRLLAGLESADAGTLAFDGEPLAGRSDDTRIMFQDARLLPWKRVVDNVALGLGADIASAAACERARAALADVGMAGRALDWPSVLSGGQRQRVALARALVHTPQLLLLDEPLGALDALTRLEMHRLIESLWQQGGFTALLVTHDVTEAVALADRVILIEDHAISLDERVPLSRPRERRAAFDEIEARILGRVLQAPAVEAASAQDAAPATAARVSHAG